MRSNDSSCIARQPSSRVSTGCHSKATSPPPRNIASILTATAGSAPMNKTEFSVTALPLDVRSAIASTRRAVALAQNHNCARRDGGNLREDGGQSETKTPENPCGRYNRFETHLKLSQNPPSFSLCCSFQA